MKARHSGRILLHAVRLLLVAGLGLGLTARAQTFLDTPSLELPQFSPLPEEPILRQELERYFAACGIRPNPLSGRRFAVYDVVLAGQTSSGPFQRAGLLFLVNPISLVGTTNGINANDLFLISGAPSVVPEPGAIRFATNSALYGLVQGRCTQAALDFAFVAANPALGQLSIQPDFNIAAAAFLNNFNLLGGLLANVFLIQDGLMQVNLQNGGLSLAGQIQFIGTGFIFPSSQLYQANFVGQLRGTGTF
ncbi:hypothetical protein JRI60_02145 [Archangium violaceum]|uniref:hypothetical protein n=1 Tax=Archangium violaceum TaxID=83451 RepID=UPI001950E476|nr:hypothetical protein [Archangium violaceum]QRN97907.1 hypothetical protein JRI60_02145 [Archangium violaceum]